MHSALQIAILTTIGLSVPQRASARNETVHIDAPAGVTVGSTLTCAHGGKTDDAMWYVIDQKAKTAHSIRGNRLVVTQEMRDASIYCSALSRGTSEAVTVANRVPSATELSCSRYILVETLNPGDPARNVSCDATDYSDPDGDKPVVEARLVCDGRYSGDFWQRQAAGSGAQVPCYVAALLTDGRGAAATGVGGLWIPVVNRWQLKTPFWE